MSCPHCGSDDGTGWSAGAEEGALDLPGGYGGEESFDYDRFVEREFGSRRQSGVRLPSGLREMLIGMLVTLIGVAVLFTVISVY